METENSSKYLVPFYTSLHSVMSQTMEIFVSMALRTLSVADMILHYHNLTWCLDVAMSIQCCLIQQRDHSQ
jgi:hypothetical protein